ncbi:MAG: GntR family transcriptional regulator [Anaerolineales bacterium]|nr:GntR family transcriptional regulator [Anaerolineales bacterium]
MRDKLLDQSLNPESPVPLYHQLKQLFIEAISANELKPGDSIPSEHTLEENLHISRSTVRRAMSELEHEGYIYRQRGRPTIVNARPIYHGATAIAGFSDDMRSQGCKPWSQVLGVSIILANRHLAERLKIAEGEEVITAYRLRLADDKPVCTERPYLPLAKVGPISPKDIEGEKSLYHYLRDKLNIRPASVEEVVQVMMADEETAELLKIAPNDPVVRLERTVYDEKTECIEYAVSLWRTDRFRYVAWRAGTAHIAVLEND